MYCKIDLNLNFVHSRKGRYLAVCRQVVGVTGLLAPRALDGVAVDVGVVDSHDGVSRGLFRRKSGKNKNNY